MKHLLAVLLICPGLLWADGHLTFEPPFLANVTGVASDDHLNVRLNPDHRTEIIGSLRYNADEIEVVALSEDTRWALVNVEGQSGWVRTRYLSQEPQPEWDSLTGAMTCFGTEPFWAFALHPMASGATFDGMDQPETSYLIDWTSPILARPSREIGLGGGDASGGFDALIESKLCNDGMSDHAFALQIRLFIHDDHGTRGYDGCCSMRP